MPAMIIFENGSSFGPQLGKRHSLGVRSTQNPGTLTTSHILQFSDFVMLYKFISKFSTLLSFDY